MGDWLRQKPLLSFFLLAFIFPWALWSILIVTTPAGELLRKGPTLFFLVLAILGGLGPSLAGMTMAAVLQGRSGVAALLAGLKKMRFSPWEYAVALAGIPLLTGLGLVWFFRLHPEATLGNLGARLAMGIAWPVFSSLGEELGWRGFALPRLQARYGPALSALALGVLWGMWHFPADYLGLGDQGALFFLNFFLLGPCLLTALSILMTWVYGRTSGSLWAMVLFHYSITFCGIVLAPQGLAGAVTVQYNLITVGLVWLAALPAMIDMLRHPRP